MKRIYPVYYICNENDESVIRFEMFFTPKDFAISKAEILLPELVPEFFRLRKLEDAVYLYLHSCQKDYGISGYLLDDFIIKKLNLSEDIRCFGRLNGMEYLIDLLDYHFYNEEYKWYVTCESPHTISFFRNVIGWNRLFIDSPVKMEDIKNVFNAQK